MPDSVRRNTDGWTAQALMGEKGVRMNVASYDVIVLGLGAMGSATAACLAGRDLRVLGLDIYPPAHAFGSSHGGSRIIREAYYEAPEYVPLVQRSYALWRDLEAATGRSLLTITGGICFGPPGDNLVVGAQRSADLHHLPYERLAADEIGRRIPGFRIPRGMIGIFEPRAGILDPEAGVEAHLALATRRGADLHHEEPAVSWRADGAGVRVETQRATYRAERLVITAGAWAGQVLEDLCLPLTVHRIVNVYFQPEKLETFSVARFPIYLFHTPEGAYYGFPDVPGQGLKIGRHDGGEVTTPQTIRREVSPDEVQKLRDVLDSYMPGAGGPVLRTATCMYTMTPDEHFILDHHPRHPNVVFGAGFSGHGYKFAPVIGEILADLAAGGAGAYDIGFLSLRRFPTLQ
jgi:sarcosine oxidase